MTLYNRSKRDSSWIVLATFSLSLFTLAGVGCQTFSGFSKQDDSGEMSLKDAPSRKRQPRTLDSIVHGQSELPSMPPSVRDNAGRGGKGINIEDVGLKPEKVHVEANLSIEEIAESDRQRLPAILESAENNSSTARPPFVSPEAFLSPESMAPAQIARVETSPPAGPVAQTQPPAQTPTQSTQSNPGLIVPVFVAPQLKQETTKSQPNVLAEKSSPAPPVATPLAVEPKSAAPNSTASNSPAPILTLSARSNSETGTILSQEFDTLLGPVTEPAPPTEFDPNSFSVGEQASQALPKPRAMRGNPDQETTESSNIQAANRISGVEHAAFGGTNSSAATQISTVDEPAAADGSPQDVVPATNASTQETTNQPRQLTWQEQLKTSIELLDGQIQKQGGGERKALDAVRLQLMQIVAGTNGGQPFDTTDLPEKQATFWKHQLSSIEVMLNGTLDEETAGNEEALQRRRATTAAQQLELAANQLADDASLQVGNATFCSQVRGFGQFTAMKNLFAPTQQVLIYCEIANYALRALPAENAEQDTQMAELRGQYVIIDENNRVVHQHQFQSVQDQTRWRRKDFYMYFPITIPQLASGRYRLQLSIEDMVGQKFASVRPDMEFTVAAPPRNNVPPRKTANSFGAGEVNR